MFLSFVKKTVIASLAIGATIAGAEVRLQGSGATFPEPLYQRWAVEFEKVDANIKIDYGGGGSGKGIADITKKVVDFAGSDAPLSKKETAALEAPVLHIPTCAGAVVPAYNLSGIEGELQFSGEVLAGIYLGKITKWNDPALVALNPNAKLPDLAITPVYRSDSSGTTFVFTSYLSTQSEEFGGKIGPGKTVQFPVGLGGAKNAGVAATVTQTNGSIGYIELNYAVENKIAFGAVKNKAGKFVKASPESVSAAGAAAVSHMKDDLAVNIWNQDGDGAYPISAFTYFLVYKDLGHMDKAKADALVKFLKWSTSKDGQAIAGQLTYAPLSEEVQQKVEAALATLTHNGKAFE
jgi:phosphate transport system substrate-binding protein